MPIYEYRCDDCKRKVSIFWRSLSAVDSSKARCSKCGSAKLTRVMSRVRVVRHAGGESNSPQTDDEMDESMLRDLESLDENDPRALGRMMRKMADQTGEPLGDEFEEVVGRLEKGESPESIEQKMGDVLGGESPESMDDGMSAPPDSPKPEAEAKPDKKNRKTVGMSRGKTKAKKSKRK